jgi:hypothetical protein
MTSDGALVFGAGGKFRVAINCLYISVYLSKAPRRAGAGALYFEPLAHNAPAAPNVMRSSSNATPFPSAATLLHLAASARHLKLPNGIELLHTQRRLGLVGHMGESRSVSPVVGYLMHNDQMMVGRPGAKRYARDVAGHPLAGQAGRTAAAT